MKDELDVLRETGSTAAAHASIALSEILGKRINLQMPCLDIIPAEAILQRVDLDRIVISVSSHILTGLKGEILFMLDEKSAFQLIDICSRIEEKDKKEGALTEMGLSIIKETGSIVISAYINALSMMLKVLIIPSIPTLISGPIQDTISKTISFYSGEDYILLIEAVFQASKQKVKGSFYLVLTPEAAKYIQDTCIKMLNSLEKK